jgi:hypothetical protein
MVKVFKQPCTVARMLSHLSSLACFAQTNYQRVRYIAAINRNVFFVVPFCCHSGSNSWSLLLLGVALYAHMCLHNKAFQIATTQISIQGEFESGYE